MSKHYISTGRLIRSKNWQRMLVFSFCSAILAAVFVCVAAVVLTGVVRNTSFFKRRRAERNQKYITQLQSFIDENHLSTTDVDMLDEWQKENRSRLFLIGSKEELLRKIQNEKRLSASDTGRRLRQMNQAVEVRFADKNVYVYLETRFYRLIGRVNLVLMVLLLAVTYAFLLLAMLRKEIEYTIYLRDELEIMKGGDFSRKIRQFGNHETGQVGSQIDALRISIAGQIEREKAAVDSNHELITTLSHDMRTPLTRLIGYLEILKLKKYNSPSELDQYIEKARNNAFIIRDTTDKLFHYFLAFEHGQEGRRIEEVEAGALVASILSEEIDYLNTRQFQVICEPFEESFRMRIDRSEFPRIFDNIFQNIERYADNSSPVEIAHRLEDGHLHLQFRNRISPHKTASKGTHLGMKIVTRIVMLLEGEIQILQEEDTYTIRLTFPVKSCAKMN